MKNRIQAYDRLLMEEDLLQQELTTRQQRIADRFQSLGALIQPAAIGIGLAKTILTRNDRQPAVQAGLGFFIDLVTGNLLFRKSGWLTKTIMPPLLKNISSHVLSWKIFKKE